MMTSVVVGSTVVALLADDDFGRSRFYRRGPASCFFFTARSNIAIIAVRKKKGPFDAMHAHGLINLPRRLISSKLLV
jgi:hypothetical protein